MKTSNPATADSENTVSFAPAPGLRSLLQEAIVRMDLKYDELRKGTQYEKSRPSDIRVFVAAARQPATETMIAQKLQISRQAVQSSVKRLKAHGVIKLVHHQNRRDKIVTPTEQGLLAMQTAKAHMAAVEAEIETAIGAEKLRALYDTLITLNKAIALP